MHFDFSRLFFIKQKKVWLPIVAIVAVLAILAPLGTARAALFSAFAAIPSILITFILQAMLGLSQVALQLANDLLKWSAGGGPFAFSATNPASNPIISIGWTLLRDVTNTFFIIGLAYIGLMTALNLGSFDTKKTFFRLLVIALFINFSPVVCGVIVDFSNLISGYFLTGVDFSMLINTFSMQRQLIWKHSVDIVTNGAIMLQVLMLIGFGAISAGIIFLFAALFFVRFPALWILVILSPLMFFFWVFEDTKKWFKDWWGQFLQWAFIVLHASFFIYLAQHTIVLSQQTLGKQLEGQNPGGGVFASISPFFAGIVFLVFGLISALKINAMGTGSIMKAASKATDYGKTALKAPVKYAAVGAGVGGALAAKGIAHQWQKRAGEALKPGDPGYEEWAAKHKARAGFTRAGRYLFGGETDKERDEWNKGLRGVLTLGGVTRLVGGAGRKALRASDAAIEASDQAKIAEAGGKVGKMTDKQLIDAIKSAKAPTKQVGLLQEAIKTGRFADIRGQLPDYMLKGIFNDAIRLGSAKSVKTFTNADPALMTKVLDEKNVRKGIFVKEERTKKQAAKWQKEIDEKTSKISDANTTDSERKKLEKELEQPRAKLMALQTANQRRKDIEQLKQDLKDPNLSANDKKTKEEQLSVARGDYKQALQLLGVQKSTIASKQLEALGLALTESDHKKLDTFKAKAEEEGGEFAENWDKKKVKKKDENGNEIEVMENLSALEMKAMMNARAGDADNWTKDQAMSYIQTGLFHLAAAPEVMTKLAEKFGSTMVQTFQESMQALTGNLDPEAQEQWYRKKGNDRMANYLGGSTARNFGLGFSKLDETAKKTSADLANTSKEINDTEKALGDLAGALEEAKKKEAGLGGKFNYKTQQAVKDLEQEQQRLTDKKASLEAKKQELIDEREAQVKKGVMAKVEIPEIRPYVNSDGSLKKNLSKIELDSALKRVEEQLNKFADPQNPGVFRQLNDEENKIVETLKTLQTKLDNILAPLNPNPPNSPPNNP